MITKFLDSQSFSKVWKTAVRQNFCGILSKIWSRNIICRPLRGHILFDYSTNFSASIGKNYKQLLDEVFVISRIIEVEVGVISRSRRLRLITLTETSIILNITKPNLIIVLLYIERKKIEVTFFASSLTPSRTKRANLTWLLLEIMHRGHTWHDYPWPWHDYPWPWHDYCIICKFRRHGRCFRKFTVGFRPIKKELESWIYNNIGYLELRLKTWNNVKSVILWNAPFRLASRITSTRE